MPSQAQWNSVGPGYDQSPIGWLNRIQGSTVLDDITRNQLLDWYKKTFGTNDPNKIKKLPADAISASAERMFNTALQGAGAQKDPMYQSRAFISTKLRLMRDQPGRAQTLLGESPVQSALDIALGKTS